MSRLLVKNLPAYLTQDRLRAHFTSADGPGGTITDVKVLLQPNGTSRRFGFVGYKTPEEAQKAQAWFDRTFVHSSKISVEVVDGAKDAPAPRPNKRPRLGPSPADAGPASPERSEQKSKGKKTKKVDDTAAPKQNDQLEAFMQVMLPRSKKGPSWKDDEAAPPTATASSSKDIRPSGPSQPDVSVDEVMDDSALPHDDAATDMDWLKQHMKSNLALADNPQEKTFVQSDDEGENKPEPVDVQSEPHKSPQDEARDAILQTGRLFLRNLPFICTEEELTELFSPFGNVAQVHIPVDPSTRTPKGMAYVSFSDPTHAVDAYEALDKKSFQGRLVHILPAVDRRGNVAVEEGSGRNKTVKEERDAKRKTMAGKEFNWSMLYMNSDAVVSSVADRMNVSKADILNPESDNAAVKLALAETHVIQETKFFLESNGVVLSAMSGPRVARSDTTILVKNIPYGTTAEQVRELFEPHGSIQRLLVPPAGTMAVVEFARADEGRKAFKAVAYRRLGNSIIYLEKGPVGMFLSAGSTSSPVTASAVPPVTIADANAATGDVAGAEGEPSLAAGSTLFVKNLSFATTQARLAQACAHLAGFAFARVQTKPDPKRPDARLSMGYGFVGFKTADAARKAMKGLQGHVLDGHALVIKFAGRGAEEQDAAGKEDGKKAHTTKMIVKNVPFEVTRKDIRELFGSHGQLKSVRVPKKFDHRSRGFAFLEFVTRQEAENAYAALKHTHLLGRHLVLQWAEEDSNVDVDELRRKAGVGFGNGGNDLPGRKRKLDMGGDGAEDIVEEL